MNVAEQIVAKAFIDPAGVVHRVVPDHQTFAWDYLGPKITKKMKTKGDAENYLKDRGWIRAQVYSEEGLGLEGTKDALNRNAQNIMSVLPQPRRVYVQVWPITGPAKEFLADDLDRLGWDALAKKNKGKTLFAALLKQIATEVQPGDKLTLQEQWARRARP
jgi:hypothetical protein